MFYKKSFGKINLSLEVMGKRDDGYHNIDTLMNKIDLFDEIYLEPILGEELILESDNINFPVDESNLIYKGWELLKKHKKTNTGMKIFVKKNIPIAAGLAGGTSNGCEVIKALNEIWNLNFIKKELLEISKPLGADSSFFFYDGLVRAQGIGDIITPLPSIKKYPLLLVNIGKPISSKKVYDNINKYSKGRVSNIVDNIGDFDYLKEKIINSMEDVTFEIYPELKEIKSILENSDGISLMSGSGPTVFGLYKDEEKRDLVYKKIYSDYKYVIKSQLI